LTTALIVLSRDSHILVISCFNAPIGENGFIFMTERFHRIIPLIKRNDPIINSLNLCSIDLTDDMVRQLIEGLNNNSFISKIVLTHNTLGEESCALIFELLLKNPKLVHLEITDNRLSNNSIIFLANVLKRLPRNRESIMLNLRSNEFSFEGAAALADAISCNVPVHWLDLRYNSNIGDKGVEKIAYSLSKNTVLTGLDLIKCGCSELGAAALSDALLDNSTLTTLLLQDDLSYAAIRPLGSLLSDPSCSLQALYLWRCNLTGSLLEVLCKSMRNNRRLTTLALSYNKLDDAGGVFIADMILKNRSLTKLHLGANYFSPTTSGFFGVALAKNNTLQFLDLSRNYFRSIGVWPITVALMDNHELKSIDLRHNRIDSSGVEMLSELLQTNDSLRSLRLSGNPFDDSSISLFAQRLVDNKTLKEVELNEIGIGSPGFISICQALKQNNTLEKLFLSGNLISTDALKAFADLLTYNSSLSSISMSGCGISDAGCRFIESGIMSNSTLRYLDVSKNEIHTSGMKCIMDSLQGNYSLLQIDWQENPFLSEDNSDFIKERITDFLERNNYYQHNLLMKDMSLLVNDTQFM